MTNNKKKKPKTSQSILKAVRRYSKTPKGILVAQATHQKMIDCGYYSDYMKKRRANAIAKGICVNCNKNRAGAGIQKCDECSLKTSKRLRDKRAGVAMEKDKDKHWRIKYDKITIDLKWFMKLGIKREDAKRYIKYLRNDGELNV